MNSIVSFMLLVTVGSTVLYNGDCSDVGVKLENRSILGLFRILKCTSNCNPLNYLNYGCFCGFGGYGTPVDEIDRCCQEHDQCYSAADDVCFRFQWYVAPYDFECHNREPICKDTDPNTCTGKICSCDIQLVKCLKKQTCPSSHPPCDIPLSKRFFNRTVNSQVNSTVAAEH